MLSVLLKMALAVVSNCKDGKVGDCSGGDCGGEDDNADNDNIVGKVDGEDNSRDDSDCCCCCCCCCNRRIPLLDVWFPND